MQVQLNQQDIELAISKHLSQIGFQTDVLTISFTAGRKGSGLSAEVHLSSTPSNLEQPAESERGENETDEMEYREPSANIFN